MSSPKMDLIHADNAIHEKYMNLALKQAKKAFMHNEVPIGAIVVDKNGTVIGRGYNRMETIKCQTGHAEIAAIQKACKKIGDWRLNDCWLYVTLEPCIMCFGLIKLSRIKGVVFGAKSPLFGFRKEDSIFGDKKQQNLPTLKKDLAILEDVKKDECVQLLQDFFQKIRKKGDQ